jgi:Ser-tRNA(Ala) deacylase AlaX
MKFERRTQKLYYEDFFLSETTAKVIKVGTDYIELDATVAYPEGGGQEADQGTISLADGRVLRFIWAKKVYAHMSGLPEFPDVQVDGVIWHMIHPDDQSLLNEVCTAVDVTVAIDIERRARLSLSHTASHLVYLGVSKFRPDAVKNTLGCHIKTDGARFDFGVAERFTSDELAKIEEEANGFVIRDALISVSAHPAAPDARLWHTEGQTIPCGGTHLDHAALVGSLQIKRKGLGAGKERISCVFPHADFAFARYHK